MLAAEKPIERLARTVTCPVCGAKPGRRCTYGQQSPYAYSHDGRLKLARGAA